MNKINAIVIFVGRIIMFHFNVHNKCVLNAINVVIKLMNAKLRTWKNVYLVVQLVICQIDVYEHGLQIKDTM